MPNALAKALAVPLAIIPRGMPLPIAASATAETVPSPPETIIASTPLAIASVASCAASISGVV
jgi:hypothetical protein